MTATIVLLFTWGAEVRASALDLELQNLRALPPGYSAWCEAGALLFKSPRSARFRITDAALCTGKPDGHVICRPPGASLTPRSSASTPACSDVTASGA